MPCPHEVNKAARLRLARGEHVAAAVLGWSVQRTVALTRRAVAAHAPVDMGRALAIFFDCDCTLDDVARVTGQPPEAVAAELERRGFLDFISAKNFSQQGVARLGVTDASTRHRVRQRVRKTEWANGHRPWTAAELDLLLAAKEVPRRLIAERLGRSVKAVRRKCEELCLKCD